MPDHQELRILITGLRRLLATNLLKGLCEFVVVKRFSQRHSWGTSLRRDFDAIQAELINRHGDLLREINIHYQVRQTEAEDDNTLSQMMASYLSPSITAQVEDSVVAEVLSSLIEQLTELQENLRVIEEREAQYVLLTDIPLQLEKDKRTYQRNIAGVKQRIETWSNVPAEIFEFQGVAGELSALVELFCDTPLDRQIRAIHPIFCDPLLLVPIDGDQAVTAACWLWDHYNQTVRALVVAIFKWACQQTDPDLRSQVIQAFESNRQLRRLATNPVLRECPQIQPFVAFDYRWPSRIKHARVDRSGVTQFLTDTNLKANPFQPGPAQFDPLLLDSCVPPLKADEVSSLRPMVLISGDAQDRASLKFLMGSQVRQIGRPQGFPIVCELTGEFKAASQPSLAFLTLIAHGVAWAWLEFLPLNAGTWFDLSPLQQRSLINLLAWHTQSKQRPIELLYLNGLTDDGEANAVKEEMVALWEKTMLIDQPLEAELLRWMEIRPPGLTHTYALLDCPFIALADINTALGNVVDVSNRLLEANVVLKVLAAESPTFSDSSDLDVLAIGWDQRGLTKMLDDRIRLAAARDFRAFADLFYPDERAERATRELVQAAHDSLGRLQRLGQKIINAHIAENATAWDYDILMRALV